MKNLRQKISDQFDDAVADIVLDDFKEYIDTLEAEIIDQRFKTPGNAYFVLKEDWQTAFNRLRSLINDKATEGEK